MSSPLSIPTSHPVLPPPRTNHRVRSNTNAHGFCATFQRGYRGRRAHTGFRSGIMCLERCRRAQRCAGLYAFSPLCGADAYTRLYSRVDASASQSVHGAVGAHRLLGGGRKEGLNRETIWRACVCVPHRSRRRRCRCRRSPNVGVATKLTVCVCVYVCVSV